MNHFLFLLLFIYVSPQTYYQLIPKFSFNFINKNFNNKLASYTRKGDAVITNDYIHFLPKKNNTQASLFTSSKINTGQFEYHLYLNISTTRNDSGFFSVWFYNNPTSPTLDLNTRFEGFGILFITNTSTISSQKTHFKLVVNENQTMKEAILKSTDRNKYCINSMVNKTVKIIMKYDYGMIRINENSNNLFSECIRGDIKIKRKNFLIGMFGYNGEGILASQNNKTTEKYNFNSDVKIIRASLFNMNKTLKDNFTFTKSDIIDESALRKNKDLVEDYSKDGKQADTKLDMIISSLKEINAKVSSIKNYDTKSVSQALSQANSQAQALSKLLEKSTSLISKHESVSQQDTLSKELAELKKKLDSFSSSKAGNSDFTKALADIEKKLSNSKAIEASSTKEIKEAIIQISNSMNTQKRSLDILTYSLAIILTANIIFMYFLYKKISIKTKTN